MMMTINTIIILHRYNSDSSGGINIKNNYYRTLKRTRRIQEESMEKHKQQCTKPKTEYELILVKK